MDDTCVVCAETLEWVAYGSCGHREVCSTCVARLRFICKDRRCCLCKFESSTVFVTKAMGDYTNVISDFSILPSDPKEGQVGPYWYHEGTQAYFDDADHFKMIKETCRLTCSECDKEYESSDKKSKRRGAFADIEKLKTHLFHQHKLSMCNLCLEGRKVFICEQKLFTKAQLSQHISTGDSEVDGSESDRGGFNGHPSCRFCRNHFYGDNELYRHMSTEHYTCHICLRRHPGQYDYYNNYSDLENHFRADHFLCEDEACLAKKFIVFASESEMKRHNAMEHGGKMTRYQRNAALQIPVSFQFRETSEQERRRHRRGSQFSSSESQSFSPQAHGQLMNGDVPLDSSSNTVVASNELNTHRVDAIVGRFETATMSDAPVQISNHTPLEESSFPPLPTVQGSSQKKSKHKSAKNTMAAHLRHQSDLSLIAARHLSRVSPVANRRSPLVSNAWLTPSTSASSLSKPILSDKSAALSSSSNVQHSRPMNHGSLIIGSGSSSRSSVSPSLSGGRSVSGAPSITSASSQLKGKAPVDSQSSMHAGTSQNANKHLVEKIRSILQFDNDKYASFKEISMQYRQDLIDSGGYLLHVHQFGLSDLVPELAKLLPDSQKQRELIDTYNYNFKQNGFHRDGVGQNARQLMSSRKGKDKLQNNGVSRSKNDSSSASVPSFPPLNKESGDATKDKSKVGQNARQLMSSRKGKDKLQNNGVSRSKNDSSSQSSASVPSFPPLNKESGDATKDKSEVLVADEEGSAGFSTQSQLNGTAQPQSAAPLQISEPGASSKKQKKKPKFLRTRLGDDGAVEQLDNHATPQPSGPVRGAWVNGGGRKLVANLSDTKRSAQK